MDANLTNKIFELIVNISQKRNRLNDHIQTFNEGDSYSLEYPILDARLYPQIAELIQNYYWGFEAVLLDEQNFIGAYLNNYMVYKGQSDVNYQNIVKLVELEEISHFYSIIISILAEAIGVNYIPKNDGVDEFIELEHVTGWDQYFDHFYFEPRDDDDTDRKPKYILKKDSLNKSAEVLVVSEDVKNVLHTDFKLLNFDSIISNALTDEANLSHMSDALKLPVKVTTEALGEALGRIYSADTAKHEDEPESPQAFSGPPKIAKVKQLEFNRSDDDLFTGGDVANLDDSESSLSDLDLPDLELNDEDKFNVLNNQALCNYVQTEGLLKQSKYNDKYFVTSACNGDVEELSLIFIIDSESFTCISPETFNDIENADRIIERFNHFRREHRSRSDLLKIYKRQYGKDLSEENWYGQPLTLKGDIYHRMRMLDELVDGITLDTRRIQKNIVETRLEIPIKITNSHASFNILGVEEIIRSMVMYKDINHMELHQLMQAISWVRTNKAYIDIEGKIGVRRKELKQDGIIMNVLADGTVDNSLTVDVSMTLSALLSASSIVVNHEMNIFNRLVCIQYVLHKLLNIPYKTFLRTSWRVIFKSEKIKVEMLNDVIVKNELYNDVMIDVPTGFQYGDLQDIMATQPWFSIFRNIANNCQTPGFIKLKKLIAIWLMVEVSTKEGVCYENDIDDFTTYNASIYPSSRVRFSDNIEEEEIDDTEITRKDTLNPKDRNNYPALLKKGIRHGWNHGRRNNAINYELFDKNVPREQNSYVETYNFNHGTTLERLVSKYGRQTSTNWIDFMYPLFAMLISE